MHTRILPFFLGTTTHGEHQSVGSSTWEITPKLSILCSSFSSGWRLSAATRRGANWQIAQLSSWIAILTVDLNDPRSWGLGEVLCRDHIWSLITYVEPFFWFIYIFHLFGSPYYFCYPSLVCPCTPWLSSNKLFTCMHDILNRFLGFYFLVPHRVWNLCVFLA